MDPVPSPSIAASEPWIPEPVIPEPLILVRHAGPLAGEVVVPGAKNSVLKLMAATLLTDGSFDLGNVPEIVDVSIMAELLGAIGVSTVAPEPGRLVLTNNGDLTPVAPYELVERIRASINVLGPLLTRCGHVRLSLPGGDDFGARPIDMHVAGLEAMGATFKFSHGYLEAFSDRLHGAEITFDFPSVGATENILMAAVYARGDDDDPQRGARAGDHRSLRLPGGDGRSRGWHRHRVAHRERCRTWLAPARFAHHGARPDPGRDLSRCGCRGRR